MIKNNLKELLKHTSIYSVGWLANMAAGVLLLPVYTRYLNAEEYGAVDLIQQMNNIFRLLFVASFTYSVGRFFHDAPDHKSKKLTISTCASCVLVIAFVSALVCVWLRNPLSLLMYGTTDHVDMIVLGAGIMVMDQAFLGLTYQYLVEKRSSTFVILNLVKLATGVSANLIFLIVFELGGLGMLMGNLASYIPSCLIALADCIRRYGLSVDFLLLRRMVRFGLPMVPATILATLMHSGDRLLLGRFSSLEELGLLALGLQFPSTLNSAMLTSFNSVWSGAMMFEISKQERADEQMGRIAVYCMTAFVVAQTVLGVFGENLLQLLAAPEFLPAAKTIPILCLGYCFHALYTFLTSKAFTDGTPNKMIFAYAIPVVFKVALTILLIKYLNFILSAWIMMIGYGVFTIGCYLLFRKQIATQFDFRRIGILFVWSAVVLALTHILDSETLLADLFVRTFLLLISGAFFWIGPFWSTEEKSVFVLEAKGLGARFVGRFAGLS